jgi:hypothetical protein
MSVPIEEEQLNAEFFQNLVSSFDESNTATSTSSKRLHQQTNKGNNYNSDNGKRPKLESVPSPIDDTVPYEVNLNERSCAVARWQSVGKVVEVLQLRGNFWKTMGFCMNQRNYLYPEEALLLVERSQLLVKKLDVRLPFKDFYEEVMEVLPLQFYLTYLKLKSLDYVTFRHNKSAHIFRSDKDVYDYLAKHPTLSLLDAVVAFDAYTHEFNWSKKGVVGKPPAAYVVVT